MNYKQYLRSGNSAFDTTPLLNNDEVFENLIQDLTKLFGYIKIDKVALVEDRGFFKWEYRWHLN